MVDKIRRVKTKSFFQFWKGFVVFTLLLIFIPHHGYAQVEIDTTKASKNVDVYVNGGTLIFNSDELKNAKIVVVLPKSEKKLETKSEKKQVEEFSDSFQKNSRNKSLASAENKIKKCSPLLNNLSEEKLSKLFRTRSLLVIPVSYSSSIKAILQKYDSSFSPLFYFYLDSYFNSNHSSFNKYVLASLSIRPPPGLV